MPETETSGVRPPVRGLVRPRLIRRIAAADLCLIVAPAGSGKTNLAQHYVATTAPAVWYRVQPADANAAQFTAGLTAALAAAALDSTLVIDDFHLVVDTPAETVVEELLGDGRRVVLATRRTPSINVSRAEIGAVVVVSADDLRFRSWETEQLFRAVYREPLPPDDAAALTRRTDGWVAGLHLFHLSTSGEPNHVRRDAIAELTGRSHYVRSYLARTVVADLPHTLREFLHRTCVFDTLTADRCDRLLGREDSLAYLQELERRQALTTSEDFGRRFRYHEVLRSHLETALREELGTARVGRWYARAAQLVEDEGALPEALALYARSESWSDVSRVLQTDGARAIGSTETGWHDWIPRHLVAADPWLTVAMARRLSAEGRLTEALGHYRRAEQLCTDPDQRDLTARERRLAEIWVDRPPMPNPTQLHGHWVERLRSAACRQPLSALGAGDGLDSVVAALAAGHVDTAAEVLRRVEPVGARGERSDGGSGHSFATLALRLCELAVRTWRGEEIAEVAERLAGDAERVGVTWVTRQARALAGCDVVEECLAAADPWGAAVAAGLAGLRALMAGEASTAAWAALAAQCRALSSETGEAWAVALGAAAGAADPDAVAVTRAAGVPGAHAVALLAAGHPDAARVLCEQIGMPWPHRLAELTARPAASVAAPTCPPVRLQLFDSFEIDVGSSVRDWRRLRPRAATTLRLLAVHSGRAVHRDALLAALWPDLPSTQARQNLQVTVSMVRGFLEPGAPRGQSRLLVRQGEAYVLTFAPGSRADVADFEAALTAARTARVDHDTTAERDALARAVECYRGALLPEDGSAEWVLRERERLRTLAAGAAAALAQLELAATDYPAAITAAHRSLDIDACRDQSWRLLITAYDHINDRAAAARARAEYANVLADLGLS